MIDYGTITSTLLGYYPQTSKIYLFGSRARGDHRINSDIDIALILKRNFIAIKQIRRKLKPYLIFYYNMIGLKLNVYPIREKRFNKTKKIRNKNPIVRRTGIRSKIGFRERERRIRVVKREGKIIFEREIYLSIQ